MLTSNQRDILAGAFILTKMIENTLKAKDGDITADARSIIESYQSWREAIEMVDIAMENKNESNTDMSKSEKGLDE